MTERLKTQHVAEYLTELITITSPYIISHLDSIHNGPHRTSYDVNNPEHIMRDDGYLEIKNVGDPVIIPGPDITYVINEDGFRSQHFKTLEEDNTNILYGGCSWTFGEALPNEYTWYHMLAEKVDTIHVDKKVTYYNTGYMGSSVQQIVKNVIAFCKKYGRPDYIFVCLPDVARSIYWSEEYEQYMKMFPNINLFRQKLSRTQAEYTKNYIHENNWLIAADYMRYLEDYCELAGIKLLWNTWHNEEEQVWERLGFNNYVHSTEIWNSWKPSTWNDQTPFPYENHKNLPYWEIGRDDGHPGTCWSTKQSEAFFAEVLNRWS